MIPQLSAPELRALMDAGAPLILVDVRTEWERGIAHIEGARLLTPETYQELLALPRDTRVVFQCHHGVRSQSAAEHFVQQGFTDVANLAGGIDAWSTLVDPTVPRY
jgi:monothiol glutaredoxin